MIVRWSDVQTLPNDAGFPEGFPCECGKIVPHEHVEIYAVSDGRLLEVKRVNSQGRMVRIVVDA